MDTVVLRITGSITVVNDYEARYNFTISPYIDVAPSFHFTMQFYNDERLKSNAQNLRRYMAVMLRNRHAAAWKRYHNWMEKEGNELARQRSGTYSISRSNT